MPAGLRIFNDGGISQISDIHHNLILVGKGTATATPDANSLSDMDGIYGKKVHFVSNTPVIFAASAPSGASATYIGKSGNTWTFVVIFGNRQETATWYAFSYPRNLGTNLGLQVFNAQGKLMYDAAQKPLRIAHFSSIEAPGLASPSSNPNNLPEHPTLPEDIYITQPRKNRTYASLGLQMHPYRVAVKYKISGVWLLRVNFYCCLPIYYSNGIRLSFKFITSGDFYDLPLGTSTLGAPAFYIGVTYQQTSWIIDVTGY